jgi:rRNA maturation endonuclease Nob1
LIKEIFVEKCKCEICKSPVNSNDLFCKYCGNDLTRDVEYVELPTRKNREVWE